MGVTMEGSKVTSKTSSLKALLLRAWRERWSDLQWGIHIKTILPRGVSGDVYNLADCILQQALVGPGPNQLVLSYLKHSLSSQLVSYAAVLQRIAKYDGFHKPHCVSCLLEFIESIQSGITCRGKPEEGILASAVLGLAHWLLQCYHLAATSAPHTNNDMLQKPAAILHYMLNCDFLTAMLYLAKHDDKDLYSDVIKKCREIEALLVQNPGITTTVPIQEALMKLCRLELGAKSLTFSGDKEVDVSEPLTYCVQALLAINVMLRRTSDTIQVANQLRLLQRLKGYKTSRLVCELIRGSMMSMNDLPGTNEEAKWGAFTFVTLPHIIRALTGNSIISSPDGDYSKDVLESVQLLLQFGPLVDLMDSPASSFCIETLLSELVKLKLLNEKQIKAYAASRDMSSSGFSRLELSPGAQKRSIPKLIIQAQLTLQGFLKTLLDANYSKIQEALPSVLCEALKSFDLILSVTSAEGMLGTFVSKVIKFNELTKAGVTSHPILFDITFIMLCSLVQTYGSQVVFGENDQGEVSFVKRWVEVCMIERGKPKCPDTMLQLADPLAVDALLAQLNSPQPDFTKCGMSWDKLCLSVPGAMKEVVLAWEQGALSATDVKRILDNMRQSMCCFPICASAWLCSYMQILHQDALLKPMNMVQQFLTVLTTEEGTQQDNFKEKDALMVQVIRKMQYDMHLVTPSKTKVITFSSHSIISKGPMTEELSEVWSGVQERGWLSVQATHSLKSLFYTAGAEWFVTNLVKEVLKLRYSEELEKAVDLVLAVFHLDIETCTEVLLLKVLPQYLHNNALSSELVEPQSSAMAKLCAYCVYAAWQAQMTNSRKRPFPESNDMEDVVASKLLRLEDGLGVKMGGSEASTPALHEPLLSALKSVFSAFTVIAEHSSYVSHQTYFVFRFLELIVTCGRDHARPLLHGMPSTLVRSVVRALPDMFTTDLVLRLYDLSSAHGRKATASDLCLLRNMALKPTI